MSKARDIANLGDSIINDGNDNVALGDGALDDASLSGSNNVAIGEDALAANTTASDNTAIGYQAATATTTGGENTAIGKRAFYTNTTGQFNSSLGLAALFANTTGSYNTALGNAALGSNTTASKNTAVGYQAGNANTTGFNNTFLGYQAGIDVTTGDANTLIGDTAGSTLTTSTDNTFVGRSSGQYMTTGSKNTIIGRYNGNQDGLDIRTSSNHIVLSDGDGNPRMYCDGNGSWTITSSQPPFGVYRKRNTAGGALFYWYSDVGGTFTLKARTDTDGSFTNATNSYGSLSDETLKENIVSATSQWDDIQALEVKNYSLISDGLDAPNMIGVIAQDLEASGMSGLVITDEDTGKKTVKYSVLYMKAVKALQEAMDRIETLETKVAALEAN